MRRALRAVYLSLFLFPPSPFPFPPLPSPPPLSLFPLFVLLSSVVVVYQSFGQEITKASSSCRDSS